MSSPDPQPVLTPVGPAPIWERGYRTHGLWLGERRLARISLGPPAFWRRGRDPYLWQLDGVERRGEAMSLAEAKRAVESALRELGNL